MLQDRCRSSSGAAGSGGRYISSARRSVPSTAAVACRIWSMSPQSQELSPSVGLPSLRGLSYHITMGTGLAVCSPAVTMVTSLPLCSPAVTMKTGLPLCSPAVSMGAGLPLCRHYGDWFTSLPSLWNWFTSLSSLWGLVYLSVALPSLWGLGYLSAVTMGTGLPLCCHYGDRATSLLSLWTQGDLSAVTMGTELRLCCLCELPFCGVCGRCRYQIPSL